MAQSQTSRSGSVTSLSQGAPRPAALMACACETIRSHASIAAARRTYDCAGVSTGPSTRAGTASGVRASGGGGGGDSGAAASNSAGSAAAAVAAAPSFAGKRLASAADVAEERSITPRWIKIDGNTLSANTGRREACGMGKGEGGSRSRSRSPPSRFAAKRIATALIRKSAFLKQ